MFNWFGVIVAEDARACAALGKKEHIVIVIISERQRESRKKVNPVISLVVVCKKKNRQPSESSCPSGPDASTGARASYLARTCSWQAGGCRVVKQSPPPPHTECWDFYCTATIKKNERKNKDSSTVETRQRKVMWKKKNRGTGPEKNKYNRKGFFYDRRNLSEKWKKIWQHQSI